MIPVPLGIATGLRHGSTWTGEVDMASELVDLPHALLHDEQTPAIEMLMPRCSKNGENRSSDVERKVALRSGKRKALPTPSSNAWMKRLIAPRLNIRFTPSRICLGPKRCTIGALPGTGCSFAPYLAWPILVISQATIVRTSRQHIS